MTINPEVTPEEVAWARKFVRSGPHDFTATSLSSNDPALCGVCGIGLVGHADAYFSQRQYAVAILKAAGEWGPPSTPRPYFYDDEA